MQDDIMNHFMNSGNSFFRSYVNTDLSLNTSVNLSKDESNANVLLVQTIFYSKKNEDGTIQSKGILINIFNEAYFPILFVLALVIATPIKWKRKWISLLIASILIFAFVYFKLFAIVMDNYSYPEMAVKPLPIVVSQIVYFYNMTLTATGTGTNLIIGLFIWLISSIRRQELNLIMSFVNKKAASN
jgi:presenilin-like A22 family membrane protease